MNNLPKLESHAPLLVGWYVVDPAASAGLPATIVCTEYSVCGPDFRPQKRAVELIAGAICNLSCQTCVMCRQSAFVEAFWRRHVQL